MVFYKGATPSGLGLRFSFEPENREKSPSPAKDPFGVGVAFFIRTKAAPGKARKPKACARRPKQAESFVFTQKSQARPSKLVECDVGLISSKMSEIVRVKF